MLPPWRYRSLGSYYVLYYYLDEETLGSFIARLYLRYKKGPDVSLPSPNPALPGDALHSHKQKLETKSPVTERKKSYKKIFLFLFDVYFKFVNFLSLN